MCVGWYALDVLFTSSTIIHLTMISIDRYIALKFPLRYGTVRTRRQTLLKITLVWVIAFCIAGPLFVLSMRDRHDSISYKGCGPETPVFVVTATLISFYIPLLIMSIMYILTVHAVHTQAQRQKGMLKLKMLDKLKPCEPVSRRTSAANGRKTSQASLFKLKPAISTSQLNTEYCEDTSINPINRYHRQLSRSSYNLGSSVTELQEAAPMLKKSATQDNNLILKKTSCSSIQNSYDEIQVHITGPEENSVKPTGRMYKLKSQFGWPAFFFCCKNKKTSQHASTVRSRQAVQVLGILFGVFVVCYLPFFLTYLINGTCIKCQPYISSNLLKVFEWLEYSGSMLNPIIYHIFNQDFRRAFQRLMRCRYT